MKFVALLSGVLLGLIVVSSATAQEFFSDFALVVRLPSYEAFLTNLGESPIRVDGYAISSPAGSLDPAGWEPMDSAGAEIVSALGQGADQFFSANPSASSLAELNPISFATWQPGQRWSIGFPFRSDESDFVLDPVFRFASPDGVVLTGGIVVPPSTLTLAAVTVIPEPKAAAMLAPAGLIGMTLRTRMKKSACDRRKKSA
jgi:hypothetical protein